MNLAFRRHALRPLLTGAGVACSLLAWAAARRVQPGLAAVALTWGPLALLGAWSIWRSRHRRVLGLLGIAFVLALWRVRGALLAHLELAYLFEHAGSLSLLGLMFGSTLRRGSEPLVTRFAATARPAMSAALRRYTRGVTLAWTLFFAAMACASVALFATRTLREWTLFATLGTPLLVALMFVAEYLARLRLVAADEQSGPCEAVLAYLRYSAAQRADPGDRVSG